MNGVHLRHRKAALLAEFSHFFLFIGSENSVKVMEHSTLVFRSIRRVGQDRKFARPFCAAMKKAGFKVVDQPQYHWKKSQGFRRIEVKVLNKKFYYLGAEPIEYCAQNVLAFEKEDDMIQYEKIEENRRIDIFDADVFATVRMLEDLERSQRASEWL